MTKLKKFLIKNKAGLEVLDYAKNMTLTEFYNNCNRGDWIIWLFSKTNPSDIKQLVLTATNCANVCRPVSIDKRSLEAIKDALRFNKYLFNEIERNSAAASHADGQAWAASHSAEAAADHASRADDVGVAIAANAAARAAAWAADYAAIALKDSELIADIVRKHLPLKIWNQEIINN